jgi:hypothetical protein
MTNDNNDHAMGKAVSGYRYNNWRMDGPPPLIVNPQADHHALLAWCFGEAQQIELLCRLHAGDDDNTAADLAAAMLSNVMGLVGVLEHIAAQTEAKGVQP